jgi:pimeloyl-ACP methyl ester carboxylesterase
MLKRILATVLTLMMLAVCLPAMAQEAGKDFAIQYATDMISGEKNSDLYAMFTDTVKAQLTEAAFASLWAQVEQSCGAFVAFGVYTSKEDSGYTVHELYLDMEKQDILLRIVVDKDGLVAGINFAIPPVATPAVTEEAALPAGLVQEDVTVGEGEWALPGLLTLPEGGSNLPAVVLVHGSGAGNRDEAVGQTKMFRDLAWALAQKGIASIRYDKRTLTYAAKYTPELIKALTVREETVIDAVLAGKVLKADSRIDGSRIFVAGHSLGAMLGPRIAKEGEGLYAGMILMNGSPLQLTDIILTQNEDVLAKLTEEERKTQQPLLDAEIAKLGGIDSMTDEQVKTETFFGMPGYYVKDLRTYDPAAMLKELQLPTFIAQGGADFQVSLANGWEAWQKAVGNESYITMKLYPDLNHVLMKYTGDPAYQYSLQEYDTPASVDETVEADIASWILDH